MKESVKNAAILAFLSGLCCSVSTAVVTVAFCGGMIGEIVVHTGILSAALSFVFWMIAGEYRDRKRK